MKKSMQDYKSQEKWAAKEEERGLEIPGCGESHVAKGEKGAVLSEAPVCCSRETEATAPV